MLYRFQDCELDDRLYELRRTGVPVDLEHKVFDVLFYLLEHRDRVVLKDELLDKLWPGMVVGEAALTRCITAARKALGDDGGRQEIIKTQHGRGYRFVASITTFPHPVQGSTFNVQEDEEKQAATEKQTETGIETPQLSSLDKAQRNPGEERGQAEGPSTSFPFSLFQSSPTSRFIRSVILAAVLLLIGTAVTVQYLSRPLLSTQSSVLVTQPLTPNPQPLPLPDKPSIVVLPFVNMSGDPGQEYFSDGITEDLTTDLSRLSALFVISRNSAFTYKGKAVKAQEVSRELGVRYVVEGSVRRDVNQVRISVQLIDATTGGHVWSERYDRELHGLFALQDEVRQKIVLALKVKLTPEEQARFKRFPSNNLEAYDYVLRGAEYHYHSTKEATAQARQMFERAIELDPQYAGAYAWLGWTYWLEWAFHSSQDPQQDFERAFALAQKAVALDDSVPDAHQLLAWVYLRKNQPEQALAEAERALALDSNYADNYQALAEVLILIGRPQEAIGVAEKALRLDPRGPNAVGYLLELGGAYLLTGRIEEAIATNKQALMHDPNFQFAYANLAWGYVLQWGWQLSQDPRVLEEALAAAQKALALNDSLPWAHAALGAVYLLQKQPDQALTEAKRAIALDPNLPDGYGLQATILNAVGKPEEALAIAAIPGRNPGFWGEP